MLKSWKNSGKKKKKKSSALMKLFSVAGETWHPKTQKQDSPKQNKHLMFVQLLYILVIPEK